MSHSHFNQPNENQYGKVTDNIQKHFKICISECLDVVQRPSSDFTCVLKVSLQNYLSKHTTFFTSSGCKRAETLLNHVDKNLFLNLIDVLKTLKDQGEDNENSLRTAVLHDLLSKFSKTYGMNFAEFGKISAVSGQAFLEGLIEKFSKRDIELKSMIPK